MRIRRTWRKAAALAVCAGVSTLAQGSEGDRFRIDAARYLVHVKALSADELGGRGNGTPGLERAAEYIAGEFKKARLEGGGDSKGYRQGFDISTELDDGSNTLRLTTPGGEVQFRVGAHYYPLSTPGPEATRVPAASTVGLAFAGYGIAAPAFGYDDYAGLDVTGKAVVVFTHEPQENDPESVFEGRALTPHSDIRQKADLAERRGARLLIVVEDPTHVTDRALTRVWTRDPQIDRFGIPVVRVDRLRLDRALSALDFERVATEIDRTLTPASRSIDDASLWFVEPLVAMTPRADNVIGVLRGTDPALSREAIVIGAHYDHLGRGGRFAADSDAIGQIHNGADDNASGTAAAIEMALTLGRRGVRFKRSIVFAAFAGEEIGLVGSRHYVRRPAAGVRRTTAMLNLDMIGRANGRVMLGGAERPPFRAIIRDLRPHTRLRLDDFREGYAADASDSGSFEREHIPTLLFFTGFHDDYHRPSDDWARIDAAGAAAITELALTVTARLAGR